MTTDEVPPSNVEDYFDDKPIDGIVADKLGHQAIATEIFTLAMSGDANTLGVFGDWGTGKSGVIGLLKVLLSTQKLTPVVFDAWQHSAEPLRRQILVTIATAIHPKGVKELKARLYESREVPAAPGITAAGKVLIVLSVIFIAIVIALSAITVAMSGAWSLRQFGITTVGLLSPVIAPALLLAFAVTVVAKLYENLPWGTEQKPPIVDERLDEELEQLIERASKMRPYTPLILIVDELDRCPPQRVAETLELTRQFLSPSGCVTIISADKTYLSRAWYSSLGIRQEDRPTDFGEYLDKVFDRQISLPPLHPAKLSSYACELASGHGGLWSTRTDVDSLIGVLVPSSVKTPRRAKALLNHFVTQYHVASSRFTDLEDAARLEKRIREFAKLCTVEMEFPTFYVQIAQSHRAASLADEVLSSREFRDDQRGESEHYPGLAVFLENLNAAHVQLRQGKASTNPAELEMQSLVRYLSRTAGVSTGSHDLLFLETPHFSFELEPGLAEELYSYAVDDQADAILVELEHDLNSLANAVRYIASRLGDAIGFELANACKTCYLLAADIRVPIDLESANAVLKHDYRTLREGRLTPYTAPGRIRFASSSGDISLAKRVIEDPAIRNENDAILDGEVVVAALENADQEVMTEAGVDYFLGTQVGALRYVVENDRDRARWLVDRLLTSGALVERLRGGASGLRGIEQEEQEFDLVMDLLLDDGRAWELGRAAVDLGDKAHVVSWMKRFAADGSIESGNGVTLGLMLKILPHDSWAVADSLIANGIPTPSDFEGLSKALSVGTASEAENELWDRMLKAITFAESTADIGVLGEQQVTDWDDVDEGVVATERLISLCKRLPIESTTTRVVDALSSAAARSTSTEDATWHLVRNSLRDIELTGILGPAGVNCVIENVTEDGDIEPDVVCDLQVHAYSLLGLRPPIAVAQLVRLSKSRSAQDAVTLRRFLSTRPSGPDLVAVAKARRASGSGFGELLTPFASSLSKLDSGAASEVCEVLLASNWPNKTEMTIYAANPGARSKIVQAAIGGFAKGSRSSTRQYAIQVLETLRPLDGEAATRVTHAMAKRVRGGVLDDLRRVCSHIAISSGASSSAIEDLRKALAGALKKRPIVADAARIGAALKAIA